MAKNNKTKNENIFFSEIFFTDNPKESFEKAIFDHVNGEKHIESKSFNTFFNTIDEEGVDYDEKSTKKILKYYNYLMDFSNVLFEVEKNFFSFDELLKKEKEKVEAKEIIEFKVKKTKLENLKITVGKSLGKCLYYFTAEKYNNYIKHIDYLNGDINSPNLLVESSITKEKLNKRIDDFKLLKGLVLNLLNDNSVDLVFRKSILYSFLSSNEFGENLTKKSIVNIASTKDGLNSDDKSLFEDPFFQVKDIFFNSPQFMPENNEYDELFFYDMSFFAKNDLLFNLSGKNTLYEEALITKCRLLNIENTNRDKTGCGLIEDFLGGAEFFHPLNCFKANKKSNENLGGDFKKGKVLHHLPVGLIHFSSPAGLKPMDFNIELGKQGIPVSSKFSNEIYLDSLIKKQSEISKSKIFTFELLRKSVFSLNSKEKNSLYHFLFDTINCLVGSKGNKTNYGIYLGSYSHGIAKMKRWDFLRKISVETFSKDFLNLILVNNPSKSNTGFEKNKMDDFLFKLITTGEIKEHLSVVFNHSSRVMPYENKTMMSIINKYFLSESEKLIDFFQNNPHQLTPFIDRIEKVLMSHPEDVLFSYKEDGEKKQGLESVFATLLLMSLPGKGLSLNSSLEVLSKNLDNLNRISEMTFKYINKTVHFKQSTEYKMGELYFEPLDFIYSDIVGIQPFEAIEKMKLIIETKIKQEKEQEKMKTISLKPSMEMLREDDKFCFTLKVNNQEAGYYQYDSETGRSMMEVYQEFRGRGLGKLLLLYTLDSLSSQGFELIEDDSRTPDYENLLDKMTEEELILPVEGVIYLTEKGQEYLNQRIAFKKEKKNSLRF